MEKLTMLGLAARAERIQTVIRRRRGAAKWNAGKARVTNLFVDRLMKLA